MRLRRATTEELLATSPRPGDRRYPTVASVSFILVAVGALAVALHLWLGWWWTYIVYGLFVAYSLHANYLIVRFERERARAEARLQPEQEQLAAAIDAMYDQLDLPEAEESDEPRV